MCIGYSIGVVLERLDRETNLVNHEHDLHLYSKSTSGIAMISHAMFCAREERLTEWRC